ncbi:MAG: hypothetical protein DIU83_08310 [Bacillota bacterium]|nr:MAG: hypothetical protein DIU83_08310 [Bacillota bacterium]
MGERTRERDNERPAGSPAAGGDAKHRQTESVSDALAAWANECAGWLALGRSREAEDLYEIGRRDHIIWARPGPDAPRGLPVMLLVERTVEEPLLRLHDAVRRWAVAGLPLYVSLPPEGDVEAWRDAARALGFRHESVQLLMTCRLRDRRRGPEPPRHDVAEAVTDRDWDDALRVIGEVYEDPPGLTAFYNPREAVRLFVARARREPAAAAALWPFGRVAGIYSVATRRRFRRLGFAYAVVEHMLRRAEAEGFTLASLRTTGLLMPLYMRHGFGVVGEIHRYRLG